MAPASGLAVALAVVWGAVLGRRQAEERAGSSAGVLADLVARTSGGGGAGAGLSAVTVMSEEDRIEDAKRAAGRAEAKRLKEIARRKKRDEDEAGTSQTPHIPM